MWKGYPESGGIVENGSRLPPRDGVDPFCSSGEFGRSDASIRFKSHHFLVALLMKIDYRKIFL